MIRARTLIVTLAVSLAACSSPQHKAQAPNTKSETAAAPARENPFAKESTLPFQAPDFTQIKDEDFQPALEEGMRIQLGEMQKIADQTDPPTFDNTLVAMEKTGRELNRVTKVLFAVAQANTNDTLQKVQQEESPKLAAHRDAIFLNPKLFARVKAIYDQRDSLGDPQSARLAERYYKNFVRSGAQLSESDQSKLKELNKELSSLGTTFKKKNLGAVKAAALQFDSPDPLAGMSDADIAAAAEAAKSRKLDGKWLLTLQNTTQQPAQTSLTNRATRKQLFEASINRAEHNDDNDTRDTIERIAQMRVEKAHLLGFNTNPDNVL